MQDKLRELTDKIYLEGVARGNKEAEAIISEARAEAEKIKLETEKTAVGIVEKAKKEADEIKKNTLSELRISFRHSLNSLKQEIENLISEKIVDEPVSKLLSDSTFVAKLIETSAQKLFTSENITGIDVVVPEKIAVDIEKYVREETSKALKSGLIISHSGTMENGFEIKPHGKGYKIRITESDFNSYIREFLRPKLIELLFEQNK
jgi:V/A-type H+-transporting ATPase subunit E